MGSKTYVFIIPSICNIGGAQLYLVNKINYLEKKGWHVNVIYARKDVILIKELEKFSINSYPYLDYATMYYRKGFVKKYVSEICKSIEIDAQGKIVIESCTVSISTWAELIAEQLKCKHICFAFEELFAMSESQRGFAFFKHERHELAGIKPQSVPLMFKGSKKYTIENSEYYIARTISIISDVDSSYTKDLDNFDCIIGSLGRLDKSFVWPALQEVSKYIDSHKGRKYAVLLIGDTKDVKYKTNIKNLFLDKAKVIITGELFPISRKLIKLVNAFVSSSGAAVMTAIEDIPTIAMSPVTLRPNGILNYTTCDYVISDKTSEKGVSELLDDIIDKKYCETNPSMHLYDNYWERRMEGDKKEFGRQLEIAEDNSHGYNYYDVFSISNSGIRRLVALYGRLVGTKSFWWTMKFLKNNIGTLVRG